MKHADLYRIPPARAQARYRKEARARFGADAVARSDAQWRSASAAEQEERLADLGLIEAGLAACCRDGVPMHDAGLAALLERHRAWVARMWGCACPWEAYAGLAQVYRETPRFRERFTTLADGLADYLPAAMEACAGRQGRAGGPELAGGRRVTPGPRRPRTPGCAPGTWPRTGHGRPPR